MTIRRLRAEDLPHLVDLERQCFTGVYAPHRFTRAHFAAYGRSARTFCDLATVEDRVVGYAAGALGPGQGSRILRLDSLAVAASARRAGLGSRLLHCALAEAGRRGCAAVMLEVAEANRAGLAFFRTRGFRLVRRLPGYYGPRQDGLLMRRPV